MLRNILFFARFFLFALLFFFADRLIFLLINYKLLSGIPSKEIALTFYHALLLDLSMSAYLLFIPAMGYIFWLLSGRKYVEIKWLSIYLKVLVILFSILSVINFNIYREWGSKINAKALEVAYTTPNEAFASSVSSPIALSFSLLLVLIAIGFVLQRFIIERKLSFGKINIFLRILMSIGILGLNFILIRGGLSGSPINQSMAYFSKNQLLNVASVNTEWNLLSSLIAAQKTKQNPYVYFGDEKARKLVDNLYYVEKDSTVSFLTVKNPNVVLVIMESFTADLTYALGGLKGVTPGLDSLMSNGVLFENIYSTGNRTDKGFMGTLAGFPTLASVNVVKWPEKTEKLPAISRTLARHGYQNSFYYGGESEFDNYKAFLLSHGIHKLVDRNDFKSGEVTSWGQFDGAVFSRQLKEINKETKPFFSTILTLTNHEPFAVPGAYRFGTADNVAKFKSTAFYTDSCISAYLKDARKQQWYKNTLFVFVADHGHIYPNNRGDVFVPERYHIPLLFYGDVIKKKFNGQRIEVIGSQSDVPSTLLAQMGVETAEFKWSKNLMNPYVKPFAFFSWDNGMGFIDNQQCVTFDNVGKMILYNSNPSDQQQTDQTLNRAKSYLQTVYEQFLNL